MQKRAETHTRAGVEYQQRMVPRILSSANCGVTPESGRSGRWVY